MISREQIVDIVSASVEALSERLTAQVDELVGKFEQLQPPTVQKYEPVSVPPVGALGHSLDLIKSLPEFKGTYSAYPAWRDASHFAMAYYLEGTANHYIAMGIFRNKIIDSANAKLSAFNTVLNFTAIMARLDQCYADKRPLQVLENELSILQQGQRSITQFYDMVDEHLTLIINKVKMTYTGKEEIIEILNERARENALRVFISGLRRPISDILFSAKPSDLPTALATAQELETNHRRHEFASTYAAGNTVKIKRAPNAPAAPHPSFRSWPGGKSPNNTPAPMDVDPGSSMFRRPTAANTQSQRQPMNDNQGFKRPYQETGSSRIVPMQKSQRVNFMPETCDDGENGNEEIGSIGFPEGNEEDFTTSDMGEEQLNFLD